MLIVFTDSELEIGFGVCSDRSRLSNRGTAWRKVTRRWQRKLDRHTVVCRQHCGDWRLLSDRSKVGKGRVESSEDVSE